MDNIKTKDVNPHKGHRNRLREKVMKNGIELLAEHEVMELILFYSIAQKNTNGIAHKLIEEFGNVAGVLDAPAERLSKIDGISSTTVFVLKSIPQIASLYMQEKTEKNSPYINSAETAYRILAPKYIGETNEVAMGLFLDTAGKLLGVEELAKGTVNGAHISSRKVVEYCVKYNATQVILCHNHPSGNCEPSIDDFMASKNVNNALKYLDSRLVDHIIIAGDKFSSMKGMPQYKRAFE